MATELKPMDATCDPKGTKCLSGQQRLTKDAALKHKEA
jgi:hypothetical protein